MFAINQSTYLEGAEKDATKTQKSPRLDKCHSELCNAPCCYTEGQQVPRTDCSQDQIPWNLAVTTRLVRACKRSERDHTKSCRGRNRSWRRCYTAARCRGAARKIHEKACNLCVSFRTYQIFLHASRASDAEVDPVNEGHGIQKTKEREHSPVDHPSIAISRNVSYNSWFYRRGEH